MKNIVILLIATCFMACTKEYEQSFGTKLISIENAIDNTLIESYFYSSDGQLSKIENVRSLKIRYEHKYHNDNLIEVATYRADQGKLIFRDSFSYNPNGTIQARYKFSINSGVDIPLSQIYEFEYDSKDRVSKKTSYHVKTEQYTSIKKYFWKGANIERVDHFDGAGKLTYEFFYKYDDKANFIIGLPVKISNPIYWSENNVTEFRFNDYSHNVDWACNPCTAEYIYNLDNYPVSIKYNSGKSIRLYYEQKPL